MDMAAFLAASSLVSPVPTLLFIEPDTSHTSIIADSNSSGNGMEEMGIFGLYFSGWLPKRNSSNSNRVKSKLISLSSLPHKVSLTAIFVRISSSFR